VSGTITPKGWDSFQHYKDRKPSWIKLHRDLLDNYEFHLLPVASKALAPCLWLLASEYEGGEIPADWRLIAFRLRMSPEEVESSVTPLIDKGFFIASDLLADCKQSACLEKEREKEKEREEEPVSVAKPKRQKTKETTLTDWLTALGDEDAIAADDPIMVETEAAGVPAEFMALAWQVFKRDWANKRQKDWRATFRNAIRGNWLKIWWFDQATEQCRLTTAGEQARRSFQ